MLIVGVAAAEVEAMLAAAVGPRLPEGACCPACGGRLQGCWRGYRRALRLQRRVVWLRVHRSLCRACGGTHALLPSFVVPRRLDAAPLIGAALELAASGLGYRSVAALLAPLPATTVRGWLRRARAQAPFLSARLWRFAQELGAVARAPPPQERPLAALLRALAATQAAAAARLGAAALPDRFGLLVTLAGAGLLARTGSP